MHDARLVLFDIDGTLLDSGGCGRASTRLAMQTVFGTPGVVDEVPFAGKTDWQILREALIPAGLAAQEIDTRLDAYIRAIADHLAALIAQYPVRPCEGALDLVAALAADPAVVVGLVTGNMPSIIPLKLRAAGFDPADFKVGAYGSDGWERAMLPPLALARARQYSGRDFAPEQVVIIGDTPGDIACARSIRARTIAVATGPFTPAQLAAHGPDYVFDSLADRPAVLAAIAQNGYPHG